MILYMQEVKKILKKKKDNFMKVLVIVVIEDLIVLNKLLNY